MKKRSTSESGGGANWMDTYGDMVTLLLCFFVLLYASSTIDASKWAQIVISFGGAPGVLTSQEAVIETARNNIPNRKQSQSSEATAKNAQKLYEELRQYVSENGMDRDVLVVKSGDEILIRFGNNVLFDTGKANIRAEAEGIMSQITEAIMGYSSRINMIRIEGHTDNVPINTREFPSNWELSTTRAVNVLRFVVENHGYPLDKISAVGYGEYHPVGDNSVEEGRRMNRRVDFVINVMPE
ncbi:MAG: flagellar motor protein MotB [Oscillospiraceae bacterium]|nr:flagellar motor protein MotB [Oscillospiraceae bacterium]